MHIGIIFPIRLVRNTLQTLCVLLQVGFDYSKRNYEESCKATHGARLRRGMPSNGKLAQGKLTTPSGNRCLQEVGRMISKLRVVIVAGGEGGERTARYAAELQRILEPLCQPEVFTGPDAFKSLGRCRLLILLGRHDIQMLGEHHQLLTYVDKQCFGGYVSSGRPIVVVGAAVQSFTEWPRFAELIGFRLEKPPASWSTAERQSLAFHDAGHPIIQGVRHVPGTAFWTGIPVPAGGVEINVVASAWYESAHVPFIAIGKGGARPGAGPSCYLALRDEPETLADPTVRSLWRNTLAWALEEGALCVTG